MEFLFGFITVKSSPELHEAWMVSHIPLTSLVTITQLISIPDLFHGLTYNCKFMMQSHGVSVGRLVLE